jgi:hypothetical protein
MVWETARAYGQDQLAPHAAEADRTGEYPTAQVRELAELGLLGMKVDPDDGGSGIDNVGYFLAMTGIGEASASIATILAASNLASSLLVSHGTPEQRTRWLEPYAAGEIGPATFCLSEPHCGSDAAALKCAAVREGDHYLLSGSKMWITSGSAAGIHLVFARSESGITCFVVERGTEGLSIGREEEKMGQRASGTVALHFDSCPVPVGNIVGREGGGYRVALSSLAPGRVGIAGVCLGIAEAAMTETLRYTTERKAFGTRIADFQNSQFQLANCRMKLDAAWLLTWRAATLLDRGERAGAESSMAKLMASETLGEIVDLGVQLHGGYGYSQEYTIERLYRDARVTRIYEGASEIQRMVIARELIGR